MSEAEVAARAAMDDGSGWEEESDLMASSDIQEEELQFADTPDDDDSDDDEYVDDAFEDDDGA